MTCSAFFRDIRGSAAAEMALVLPLLGFIFINVADFSLYLYSKMQVDLAAQEAVGAARVLCDTAAELPATTSCATLTTKMLAAAQTTSLGSNVTIGAPSEAYYCANSAAELTQVAAIGTSVPATCAGTIATSTAKPGDYISVTASYPFSSVFPGASVAAILPATIQRTAWLRLQ